MKSLQTNDLVPATASSQKKIPEVEEEDTSSAPVQTISLEDIMNMAKGEKEDAEKKEEKDEVSERVSEWVGE